MLGDSLLHYPSRRPAQPALARVSTGNLDAERLVQNTGVGAGKLASDCAIGSRFGEYLRLVGLGIALPRPAGVCLSGKTTAIIDEVGIAVAGFSAEATSQFQSRRASPLNNTPDQADTAKISTPNESDP